MRKAAVRAVMARAVAGRGMDLVGQASATAAEIIRSRRDPAMVAQRRRQAARRRATAWSVGALIPAAFVAYAITQMASGGVGPSEVAMLVVFAGLLVWCLVGSARAAVDLRRRIVIARSLPAPQPRRPAVTAAVRQEIGRLDGYSDGLRQLVSMIGISGDGSVRRLRDDIIATADAAENRIRNQAAELTALVRARSGAPAQAISGMDDTAASLVRAVRDGVQQYGALVTAAGETAAASRELVRAIPGRDEQMDETIDQLRALAAGMRELTGEGPARH